MPSCPFRIPSCRAVALALVGALAFAPVIACAAEPPEVPMIKAVSDSVKPFVDRGDIAGAVTLVARDGKIVHLDVYGYADIAAKRKMKTDDLFWIASMTKPMTAACLMMLVEEGKVNIDDPVEKYLPEFKGMWMIAEKTDDHQLLKHPTKPPTVRNLLTHTSGFPDTPMPHEGTPLSQWVSESARGPLQFEPGSKWQYNNPNINALGRIVEVISGQKFEDFLDQRLLKPLGMNDTTFYPSEAQLPRVAKSYKKDENGGLVETQSAFINGPVASRRRTVAPSGGLFSTATDIVRFYDMLLAGGTYDGKRLLKEESVKELTRTQTGDLATGFTEGMSFGLGFGVVKTPHGVTGMLSPGTFGHGGVYGTASWADPKRKIVYVMMMQQAGLVPNGDACEERRAFQQAASDALDAK